MRKIIVLVVCVVLAMSGIYTVWVHARSRARPSDAGFLPMDSAQPSTNLSPSAFRLTSPAVVEGGALPKEYTCDGASATLPLEWRNAPAGAKSFAVIMHHIPGPGDSHWYWVLYAIPAAVHRLPQNVTGVGILGNNSVNGRTEYAPPCSKGPGPKRYTYTVYALSALPQLNIPPAEVSRDVLLAAIQDRTLAQAVLNVIYTR